MMSYIKDTDHGAGPEVEYDSREQLSVLTERYLNMDDVLSTSSTVPTKAVSKRLKGGRLSKRSSKTTATTTPPPTVGVSNDRIEIADVSDSLSTSDRLAGFLPTSIENARPEPPGPDSVDSMNTDERLGEWAARGKDKLSEASGSRMGSSEWNDILQTLEGQDIDRAERTLEWQASVMASDQRLRPTTQELSDAESEFGKTANEGVDDDSANNEDIHMDKSMMY